MDWKLELVAIPVSDVDRAKAFYTEQVGFKADRRRELDEPHPLACPVVVVRAGDPVP